MNAELRQGQERSENIVMPDRPESATASFRAAHADAVRVAQRFFREASGILPAIIEERRPLAEEIISPLRRLLADQISVCAFTLRALEASVSLPGWEPHPDLIWQLDEPEARAFSLVAEQWLALLHACAEDVVASGAAIDAHAPEIIFLFAQVLLLDADYTRPVERIPDQFEVLPSIAILCNGRGLVDSGNASNGARALGHRMEDDYRRKIGVPTAERRGRPPGSCVDVDDVRTTKANLRTIYRDKYDAGHARSARVTVDDVASGLGVSRDTVERALRDEGVRFRDL
jgi:hypothetical protein